VRTPLLAGSCHCRNEAAANDTKDWWQTHERTTTIPDGHRRHQGGFVCRLRRIRARRNHGRLATGLTATANAVEDSCADIELVFAREATDAPVAGASSAAFVDPHLPDPPGVTTDYRVPFGVEQSLTDIANVGKRSQVVAATCPATKIVRGSYVQGDRRGRVRHVQRRTFWIRPARRTRSGRRGLRPNAAFRWRHGYCLPDVPYRKSTRRAVDVFLTAGRSGAGAE